MASVGVKGLKPLQISSKYQPWRDPGRLEVFNGNSNVIYLYLGALVPLQLRLSGPKPTPHSKTAGLPTNNTHD